VVTFYVVPYIEPTAKSTQSLLDEYINRNDSTRKSKKRLQRNESSLLQSVSKPKLSVQYLDKENTPHRLPIREKGGKGTQFDFATLNHLKEDKSATMLSKHSILPPIDTSDKKEVQDNANEREKMGKDSEVGQKFTGDDNIMSTDQYVAVADQTNLEWSDAQHFEKASSAQVLERQLLENDVSITRESQKRKPTQQAIHAADMKPKRKHSGYHRSVNRIRKSVRNADTIRMLDQWIELLESTEFITIPQVNVSDYFNSELKAKATVASVRPVQQAKPSLPSNIDVMNFFDKPKSAILRFDKLRSLNRQTMLIKASHCSRHAISHKCKEEVLAENTSRVRDEGPLASLLAVHGLGHLMNKPHIKQHESGYLLHKPPKRLLTGHDRLGQHRDKRAKTLDRAEDDLDIQKSVSHHELLSRQQSESGASVAMESVSCTCVIMEEAEKPELDIAATDEILVPDDIPRAALQTDQPSEPKALEMKLPIAPKKSVAKSVVHMALPDQFKSSMSTQDMKGKKLVQIGRQVDRAKPHVPSTDVGRGVMLQLPEPINVEGHKMLDTTVTSVPSSSRKKENDTTSVVETSIQSSSEGGKLEDVKPPLLATQEPGLPSTSTDETWMKETTEEIETTENYLDDKEVDSSTKSVGKIKRGKRKPSTLESAPVAKKDNISIKSSQDTKAKTTPRITILNQQGNEKPQKVGKFLYSSSKKDTGPTIKGYSTCLIEGGSVIYRHMVVPAVTKTRAIDEATGKFAFMRRKNLNKLKKRGKGKSVKKINPLLKYGIPQGMLPTAMLLMTAADLPEGKQRFTLSTLNKGLA